MPDTLRPRSIADLPAQKASAPATPAQARARFFNPGNAFNMILPPVPDTAFVDEPAKALDPATPTGLIDCDASATMECGFPATSPLVLASYARIRAGETLDLEHRASARERDAGLAGEGRAGDVGRAEPRRAGRP